MHLPVGLGAGFAQGFEKTSRFWGTLKYRLLVVAAVHDVTDGPFELQSELFPSCSQRAVLVPGAQCLCRVRRARFVAQLKSALGHDHSELLEPLLRQLAVFAQQPLSQQTHVVDVTKRPPAAVPGGRALDAAYDHMMHEWRKSGMGTSLFGGLIRKIRRRSGCQIFAKVRRTPRLEYFRKAFSGRGNTWVERARLRRALLLLV